MNSIRSRLNGWLDPDEIVLKGAGEIPLAGFGVTRHRIAGVFYWGGVRGIVDEADVRVGKVAVIAPRDFMQHTISENVTPATR